MFTFNNLSHFVILIILTLKRASIAIIDIVLNQNANAKLTTEQRNRLCYDALMTSKHSEIWCYGKSTNENIFKIEKAGCQVC